MVFSGLVTAWRLAICPTRTSPLSSHPTTDGVSREPSSLTMTLASLPSITATTLFVVPRSIPIILPIEVLRHGQDDRSAGAGMVFACWLDLLRAADPTEVEVGGPSIHSPA